MTKFLTSFAVYGVENTYVLVAPELYFHMKTHPLFLHASQCKDRVVSNENSMAYVSSGDESNEDTATYVIKM